MCLRPSYANVNQCLVFLGSVIRILKIQVMFPIAYYSNYLTEPYLN